LWISRWRWLPWRRVQRARHGVIGLLDAIMRRGLGSFSEADCAKGRGGASDSGCDLFVVNSQLGSAFLNAGGERLRLGLGCESASPVLPKGLRPPRIRRHGRRLPHPAHSAWWNRESQRPGALSLRTHEGHQPGPALSRDQRKLFPELPPQQSLPTLSRRATRKSDESR
jgi:hypothetical protein